ncbi:MAG: hypothetical protein RLZZ480_829 [Candidatus Parcubacteria bacterium]|jgi:hypothetical protein
MKSFLIRSALFFLFAALVSVGLFVLVSLYGTSSKATLESVKDTATSATDTVKTNKDSVAETLSSKIPEKGIPLSSLPLSETQKKALAAAQIDVASFVITKTMLTCGAEKLGEERIQAIIGGEAPTLLETTKLIPCLKS